MRLTGTTTLLALISLCLSCSTPDQTAKEQLPFEANWESLANIDLEPEWFKEAKLGIYFHWGPYSVPAFDSEWYPRWMYVKDAPEGHWGGRIYPHHQEVYGSDFNYHDFIPLFKAEHFDANEWAQLFKQAGARFAGPVAQHHDGFAMWASEVNPWNVKDMGPKRDITGDLFKSLRQQGLKTVATFHHARVGQRYANDTANWAGNGPEAGFDSHYPYHPDLITSTTEEPFRKLYGNLPENEFNDYWLNQVNEVVDQYGPDIIWFDSWLDMIPEHYRQSMVAHHFNTATERAQEPIAIHKQEDLPATVSLLDIEQGGKTDISEDYWMTDITINWGAWSYHEGQECKPPHLIIRNMIDVWSKKGIVLLNISPKADGVIPEAQKAALLAIGQWIEQHQEAVYDTRVHVVYGYGSAQFEKGHFGGQSATMQYNEKDFRFTRSKSGNSLYLYVLGLPEAQSELKVSYVEMDGKIAQKVSIVGSGEELGWSIKGDELTIQTPEASKMNEIATVFKIDFD